MPTMYGTAITLQCKDATGTIIPWSSATHTTFRPWTHAFYSDRDSPLTRVAELFNVNHFIISQARPYIIPFLSSSSSSSPFRSRRGRTSFTGGFLRLLNMEIHHRLHQLDSLGVLPRSIRRFLVDEITEKASVTLVPSVGVSDFARLLETPTREGLKRWILRGERSVWPAVGALKIRVAVESELDRGYQYVRSRKPRSGRRRGSAGAGVEEGRVRASSAGGKW